MRRYWRQLKNFWRYGKIGWQMNCNCCYDPMLDLIISRLQQMEESKHYVVGRANDVKNMRVVRTLLERLRNDTYTRDDGIGLWKPVPRQGLPWDKEGYVNPYAHIPTKVFTRWMGQEVRDFQYALDVMKRQMLRWWQ